MRLDKLLEYSNIGSRRKVKALIRSKQVTVDGQVVRSENLNVDPGFQTILVEKKQVIYQPHVYYMMNKPQGVITAVSDTTNQTVLQLVMPQDRRKGLYPIGRLDKDTEGLLLITDNGQLGYQLLLPEKKVVKCYEVIVNARLTNQDYLAFKKGIIFADQTQCQPAELTIKRASEKESLAHLAIAEGKFHQVKKMFLSVGKKVIFLKRLSMGPIWLDESLVPGTYRPLNQAELTELRPYFTSHKKEKSIENEV